MEQVASRKAGESGHVYHFRQAVWFALMISSAVNTMIILVESGPSLSLMFIFGLSEFANIELIWYIHQLVCISAFIRSAVPIMALIIYYLQYPRTPIRIRNFTSS